MRERPILFSGPMVRAILEGRKTQTRRVVKPQPEHGWLPEDPPVLGRITSPHPKKGRFGLFLRRGVGTDFPEADLVPCPYGQPGDRLWVKETWRPFPALMEWDLDVTYAADRAQRTIRDGEFGEKDWAMPKAAARGNVSPLFMPRWASRLVLEVSGVRVERLHDISEADALAEGIQPFGDGHGHHTEEGRYYAATAVGAFAELWAGINGSESWDGNPWVWVVEFKRVDSGQGGDA